MHNSPRDKPIIEKDFIYVFYLEAIDDMIVMVVKRNGL